MIDATLYNITVRKGNFDGEVFFEAKIKELPDVCEYADSYDEAYNLAIDTIEATAEAFLEDGKTMPCPIIENDDFSGRVTLRMPKSMHASYVHLAEKEDISLNQLLISKLSYGLGHQFGYEKSFPTRFTLGTKYFSKFQDVVSERKAVEKRTYLKDIKEIYMTQPVKQWHQPIAANGDF